MLLITSLLEPTQLLSRLTNMVFGENLLPTRLATIAETLPPMAMVVMPLTTPSLACPSTRRGFGELAGNIDGQIGYWRTLAE